jgi:hypothetical protein
MSLFGSDPDTGLIASGFTIRKGLQWRCNSASFNHWQALPYYGSYTMDKNEQEFVKVSDRSNPLALSLLHDAVSLLQLPTPPFPLPLLCSGDIRITCDGPFECDIIMTSKGPTSGS